MVIMLKNLSFQEISNYIAANGYKGETKMGKWDETHAMRTDGDLTIAHYHPN